MKREDCLIEIHTEELPPKSLIKLAAAFQQQVEERLQKANLIFERIDYFASPRRLALLVRQLSSMQPDLVISRMGPALPDIHSAVADFMTNPAVLGFARSCGVSPDKLELFQTPQGMRVRAQATEAGKSINELLPNIVEQALQALPIPKRMRWGARETQFVRPVHSVILLFGNDVIDATILGCKTDRITYGHRFHAPAAISVPTAAKYTELLEKAYVIADVAKRREKIHEFAIASVKKNVGDSYEPYITDELLNEVTGLVEWPVALCGKFDAQFLIVPKEVLISSMQDHQRYFPVIDANGALQPYFITMSNIDSKDAARVIRGNERVLHARLADAEFFFKTDLKKSLDARIESLKGVVFQAKLGTLYDKSERLSALAAFIAKQTGGADVAARAGLLAKTDLMTSMVGEFPELQGVMGGYYAICDREPEAIATALQEQYKPRFSGDTLPATPAGRALALADRLDTLVGAFGIGQLPTGDKDPYGLRRAAIGVLRILITDKIDIDLRDVISFALQCYTIKLANPDMLSQLLNFLQERLRAWYQEQGITADVFASVAALGITRPLDIHKRIQAVQAFKQLAAAESLSGANKRVSNILAKYTDALDAKAVNAEFFEHAAEKTLADQLAKQQQSIEKAYAAHDYQQVLVQLAELRQPVDDFFDNVMVMTDDKQRRENRLLLLKQLRALFLQVADIALLQ